MGQKLSKKVLQKHIIEANKMENILQNIFDDMSIRLNVFTGKVLHDPKVAISDFVGWVKYLVIYNPELVKVTDDEESENDVKFSETAETLNNYDCQSSHQLRKKVLTCENFLYLRRLCYEYERLIETGTQKSTEVINNDNNVETKRKISAFDPDECSICMDASIDIVLPCLHGYCSVCWEDWSTHSQTCPHCRGEVKECGSSQQTHHKATDDIWQYESWSESDMNTQLLKLKQKIVDNLTTVPSDLTREMMHSHCILSPNGEVLGRDGTA